MPYASNGVYTPVTGSENASSGVVIKSATWNSIFVDLAAALTEVGQLTWVQEPTTESSGSFSVTPSTHVIFVTVSAPTITLAPSSLATGPVTIIGDGNASIFASHNSVVVPGPGSGDTIDSASTYTMTSNNQINTFYPLSGVGYMVK